MVDHSDPSLSHCRLTGRISLHASGDPRCLAETWYDSCFYETKSFDVVCISLLLSCKIFEVEWDFSYMIAFIVRYCAESSDNNNLAAALFGNREEGFRNLFGCPEDLRKKLQGHHSG